MNKAIEQFLINFSGATFSSPESVELFMRERIPALVEKIYKEELAVADRRFEENEEYRKEFSELSGAREIAYGIALDKQKEAFTKEIDKALREVKGGGNGRRLLVELKGKINYAKTNHN